MKLKGQKLDNRKNKLLVINMMKLTHAFHVNPCASFACFS